jgi:hypothetical protein
MGYLWRNPLPMWNTFGGTIEATKEDTTTRISPLEDTIERTPYKDTLAYIVIQMYPKEVNYWVSSRDVI